MENPNFLDEARDAMDSGTIRTRKRVVSTPFVESSEPGFLRYLRKLAKEADSICQKNEIGFVESEVVKLTADLTCLQVQFVSNEDDDDNLPKFNIFAAGRFSAHDNREISMIEIIRADTNKSIFVSNDATALLAIINPAII